MMNQELELLWRCYSLLKDKLYDLDPDNKRGTAYRARNFLEHLESLLRKEIDKLDSPSPSDAFIPLADLYKSIRPNEPLGDEDENSYIRDTILRRLKADQSSINELIEGESLKLGLKYKATIKSKKKNKVQYWGVVLEEIVHEAKEDLSADNIEKQEIPLKTENENNPHTVAYREKPLGSLIGPTRWSCSKLKASFGLAALIIFSIPLCWALLTLILSELAEPILLLILYPFIVSILILVATSVTSQFPAPLLTIRRGMKYPIIVNNESLGSKYIDLEIKNVEAMCKECAKIGRQSKVNVQRRKIYSVFDLEGRCEYSSGHRYTFDGHSLTGERKI